MSVASGAFVISAALHASPQHPLGRHARRVFFRPRFAGLMNSSMLAVIVVSDCFAGSSFPSFVKALKRFGVANEVFGFGVIDFKLNCCGPVKSDCRIV